METSQKSQNSQKLRSLRQIGPTEVIKRCSKCDSVFITSSECESCGHQFWVDQLGEPFGPRSFYVLQEDFYLEHPFILKIYPEKLSHNHSYYQRYRRFLVQRFEVLCEYLFQQTKQKSEYKRFFLLEAKELITEYVKLGGSRSKLWIIIEGSETSPFFSVLAQVIEGSKAAKQVKASYKNPSSIDLVRNGVLAESLLAIGAIVLATFLLLKYLIYSF